MYLAYLLLQEHICTRKEIGKNKNLLSFTISIFGKEKESISRLKAHCCWEIASLNPDDLTAIHGQEPREQK